MKEETWQSTACILCSINCGIKVQVEEGKFVRIQGDKNHPASKGYLCQKAARLDHYQNHNSRLTHPLRKKPDGSFEKIDWDTAIREVAEKLAHIRDTYGGHSIAYYGGGGQGNHLGGAYSGSLRKALGTPYIYNSLAQEKTGDFWVNGKLFGRQTCHISEDIEEADYAIIIGANPWQAHGFPRARKVLQEISKDPKRTLVVVDPRRTRTAELADIHLQVKPGMDAFLIAAMLGVIVQEGLEDKDFLEKRTLGFSELADLLQKIPVEDYAQRAGIEVDLLRKVARGFASASCASSRHDLGVEHSLHSTLNTYLEKLLCLITGNFGKKGGNNLHTQFVPLIGHSKDPSEGGATTKVTGMKEISKFFPPNILPAEIDTDHPERVRAVFVDSSNPLQSAADTKAYQKAFSKLDLLVVIDVAETETTEMADYILPACSQYEKWEATFFSLSFPTNYFHLRRPITPLKGNTLPEPEIYFRLLVALGAIPAKFPFLEAFARLHRRFPKRNLLSKALALTIALRPGLKPYLTTVLYASLGKALPQKAQAASIIWGTSHFYAKRYAKQVKRAGFSDGEELFNFILENDTGVAISTHTFEEMWQLVAYPDQKIRLAIPEMLTELADLSEEKEITNSAEYPFILAAGERRSYNANQIYRNPAWRKNDPEGALRIHPKDLKNLGFQDGEHIACQSAHGSITVCLQSDDSMREGALSLPHGYGMSYWDSETKERKQNGPSLNLLTTADHCDPLAKTPYHKYIPVRLLAIK